MKHIINCIVLVLIANVSWAQYDDLYFNSKDRKAIEEAKQAEKEKQEERKKPTYQQYTPPATSMKEPRAGVDYPIYNQWKDSLNIEDNRDYSNYQKVLPSDEVYIQEYSTRDDQGNYYSNDSYSGASYDQGYEDDYTYSNNINRFYSPTYVSNYNGYGYSNRWNDGYWGNSFYDPWNSYYSPSWSIGYSSYGGWGFGVNTWGSPYYGYGWNRPYYNRFCAGPVVYNPWRYGYGWNSPYYGGYYHDHHHHTYKNNKPTVNHGYRSKTGSTVVNTPRPSGSSSSSSSRTTTTNAPSSNRPRPTTTGNSTTTRTTQTGRPNSTYTPNASSRPRPTSTGNSSSSRPAPTYNSNKTYSQPNRSTGNSNYSRPSTSTPSRSSGSSGGGSNGGSRSSTPRPVRR